MSSDTEATLSQAALATLLEYGTATIYEASHLDCALDPGIGPMWRGSKVAGRALPVRCHPADNLPLHRAIEQAEPGDVLVVDGAGVICGYWGEVLAVAAQSRGVAGLVIDGGVRDIEQLEHLGFPVFARGLGIHRTGKNFPGLVGEQISVGGVVVGRGDAVVADSDGVVVLPVAEVPATISGSERRIQAEVDYMRRLKGGETTMDIMGLRHA